MDFFIELLTSYGNWGMFLAAFLAGSFFPFSSEAVMLALLAAGLDPYSLVAYGTVGNVLGSAFNYGVGRMGRLDWIESYFHVSEQSLRRAEKFMSGHGALMGFFSFLPVLGSAISIVLGLMRANIILSFLSITAGKFLRYLLLVYSVTLFAS